MLNKVVCAVSDPTDFNFKMIPIGALVHKHTVLLPKLEPKSLT